MLRATSLLGRRVEGAVTNLPSSPCEPGSITSFLDNITVPLEPPLVSSPPRARATKTVAATDEELVPKRSARLAVKSRFRATKPDAQVRKVLMKKLGEDVPTEEPDRASFVEFQVAFQLPGSFEQGGDARVIPWPSWASHQVRPPARRGRQATASVVT